MHDPKLVEALAAFGDVFCMECASYDCIHCSEEVEAFIAHHRLVQLPEEPIEWEVEWGSDKWIGFQTMEDAVNFAKENRPSTTGRIRAVRYLVRYGDPQEVEP